MMTTLSVTANPYCLFTRCQAGTTLSSLSTLTYLILITTREVKKWKQKLLRHLLKTTRIAGSPAGLGRGWLLAPYFLDLTIHGLVIYNVLEWLLDFLVFFSAKAQKKCTGIGGMESQLKIQSFGGSKPLGKFLPLSEPQFSDKKKCE